MTVMFRQTYGPALRWQFMLYKICTLQILQLNRTDINWRFIRTLKRVRRAMTETDLVQYARRPTSGATHRQRQTERQTPWHRRRQSNAPSRPGCFRSRRRARRCRPATTSATGWPGAAETASTTAAARWPPEWRLPCGRRRRRPPPRPRHRGRRSPRAGCTSDRAPGPSRRWRRTPGTCRALREVRWAWCTAGRSRSATWRRSST